MNRGFTEYMDRAVERAYRHTHDETVTGDLASDVIALAGQLRKADYEFRAALRCAREYMDDATAQPEDLRLVDGVLEGSAS